LVHDCILVCVYWKKQTATHRYSSRKQKIAGLLMRVVVGAELSAFWAYRWPEVFQK